MILSTWLGRPLSVAGRLAVKNGNGIEGRLVNIDRDLCVIPNVAIHMNREMNKGVEYNPQVDHCFRLFLRILRCGLCIVCSMCIIFVK